MASFIPRALAAHIVLYVLKALLLAVRACWRYLLNRPAERVAGMRPQPPCDPVVPTPAEQGAGDVAGMRPQPPCDPVVPTPAEQGADDVPPRVGLSSSYERDHGADRDDDAVVEDGLPRARTPLPDSAESTPTVPPPAQSSPTTGIGTEPNQPRSIAGRRRRSTAPRLSRNGQSDSHEGRSIPGPRPSLICRKPPGSLQWELILSANEGCQVEAVHQNDEPVAMVDSEWPIPSFTGKLSVKLRDGRLFDVPLFIDNALIFKLKHNWVGEGHLIQHITKGHFILIAPRNWSRAGSIPVEHADCIDPLFAAHYHFEDELDPRQSEPFPGRAGSAYASVLELTGESIYDDSEEGSLFVGVPPQLTSPSNTVWARIGEESRHGWPGENFRPSETSIAEVLDRRQGYFFIRAYDEERLLDSDQFRYLADLREILVNGATYTGRTLLVPTPSGHSPTEVRFIGRDQVSVRPILRTEAEHVECVGTGIVVDPHPEADTIHCTLEAGASRVDIVLKLPRVWWMIRNDSSDGDTQWHDRMVPMTRQEFQELAEERSVLHVRVPKRVLSVSVGFGDEIDVTYRVRENCVKLPCFDFLAYDQIRSRLAEDTELNVRFNQYDDEDRPDSLSLIRIYADSIPTIVSFTAEPTTVYAGEMSVLRWTTRHADDISVIVDPGTVSVEPNGRLAVRPSETTIYRLSLASSGVERCSRCVTVNVRPLPCSVEDSAVRVKRKCGWRLGKGFSRGELRAAGLQAKGARHGRIALADRTALTSIPYDGRRRTTHPANVERLSRLIHV